MTKRISLLLLLFGIGIGFVMASILNFFNPRIEYVDYTEEEIIAKARELGMIDIKEYIQRVNEDKDKGKTDSLEIEVQNGEEVEAEGEEDFITFEIKKGEYSEDIIDNLYTAGIISDKEEFKRAVLARDAEKRFKYGIFKIKRNEDYDTIVDILCR